MPQHEIDPDASKMLDSIKATLTRVLGPESAMVVEFYVDNHLALKDPEAFERALSDFLGSQAGQLLIEAIGSDLKNTHEKSRVPEHISKFLKASARPRPVQNIQNRPRETPARGPAPKSVGEQPELFITIAIQATERGVVFKDLVSEGLVASQGATCGYATLACLGRKAMDNPVGFSERAASLFGLDGMTTMLDNLTTFCETKAKARQLTTI